MSLDVNHLQNNLKLQYKGLKQQKHIYKLSITEI